jgi:hypothetical protein
MAAPERRSLCLCGCGKLAPLSTTTHLARGYRKGEPLRFVRGHGRRKASEEDRFQKKLVRVASGCLEFQGHRHNGYGQFGVGSRDDGTRRLVYAHRYAWELAGRTIPDGMKLLHSCDNPPCCDVEHLFVGDDQDNLADMAKKGRGRTGVMPFGVARNHDRYMANVSYKKKKHYLGTFDTIEEAHSVAVAAKEAFHATT